VDPKDPPALAVLPVTARDQSAAPAQAAQAQAAAEAAVTALYQQHALGLTRLAHVMLGDQPGAEDVVHEAFYGLYRRWSRLKDPAKAPQYLRSSVLNGCRTQLRRPRAAGSAAQHLAEHAASAASAESDVLAGEDRQAVLAAITRLPDRQREVLVLRYYLDEPEGAIAATLGIGGSTVRSTLSRALKALGADLREHQ
jgi:RNA polymerase sigma-70 factor (sigma-E family)